MQKLQTYVDRYNQIIEGLDVSDDDWSKGFDLYLEQQRISEMDIQIMAFKYAIEKHGTHEQKAALKLI